ncbi:MAG: hypothetical protein ISR01_06565 [Chitinophagales bacterium]|nr:hypothetical protein [Chitinophagales bacterium]
MRLQSEVQQDINTTFQGNVNIEKLFELAIDSANKSYKLKAMDIAREALIFAKQSNDYLAVNIHGFLAVLSIDFKKTSHAKIHVYNALNRLDANHFSYASDKQYLNALLRKINRIDFPIHQLNEPIAA